MQPKDIENYLNDLMKEEIERNSLKIQKNCFQPMLLSGEGN